MSTDNKRALLQLPLADLLRRAPYAGDFFGTLGLKLPEAGTSLAQHFDSLDAAHLEDLGLERQSLSDRFLAFLALLEDLKAGSEGSQVESITILGGHDKSGTPEEF